MDTATVFTNLTCNQRCAFCTFRREKDDVGFTAPARVRRAIGDAAAQGAKTLVLSGGEPTLDAGLAGHVRVAREAGFDQVILETNGMVLAYPGRAEALARAGLSTVRVALNATGPASDAITEVDGGFDLTLRGADRAAQAGLALEISTALTSQNLEAAAALPAFVAERLPAARRIVLRFVTDADKDSSADPEVAAVAVAAMARAAREAGVELRFDPRHALPLCLFPARRRYPELFSMGPPQMGHGFGRVEACARCVASESCPGIQSRYLEIHGTNGIEPLGDPETRFVRGLGGARRALVEKELTSDSICYTETEAGAQLERIVRINFHCNQDCPFCFVNRDLPAEDPERIRAEIERAGRDGARLLSLSGGEPTLNPHLPDYIRHGAALGLLVQLQTNAIRCARPGYAGLLREAGLVRAFVSLHAASAEVSDAVTRAPGTFKKTLAGITALVEAGVDVWLNCVITRRNFQELPALVELIHREWGTAPRLNLSYANASTDLVPVTPEITPRFSEVRPFVQRAVRAARSLGLSCAGLDGECGLPLCFLDPEWIDFERLTELPEPNPAPGFEKPASCDDCRLSSRCVGVRAHYAELHGFAELVPVTAEHAGPGDGSGADRAATD